MQLEKFVWTGVAIGVALAIGTAPISAKPGAVKPSGPKQTTRVSSPKPTTHGSPKLTMQTSSPKTTRVSSPKTTHSTGPKTTTHGQSAAHAPKKTSTSATTTTKGNGNSKAQRTATTSTTTTETTTTTTTSGGTTTTAETAPLTKSQQLLTKNTNLQSKMQTRLGTQLPDGVTVIQAASGFKNLGQFVAAVNVSNNLGIPFADLKAKMTGLTVDGQPITTTGGTTTAPTTMSLGQAIQSLKGVDSTTATQTANTATTQANAEITSTTTTTTTTTTSTTSKAKKRH